MPRIRRKKQFNSQKNSQGNGQKTTNQAPTEESSTPQENVHNTATPAQRRRRRNKEPSGRKVGPRSFANRSERQRKQNQKPMEMIKVSDVNWLFPSKPLEDEEYIDAPIDPKKIAKEYKELKIMLFIGFLAFANHLISAVRFYFVKCVLVGCMWAKFWIVFNSQTLRERGHLNLSHGLAMVMAYSIFISYQDIGESLRSNGNYELADLPYMKLLTTHIFAFAGAYFGKYEEMLKNDEYVGGIFAALLGLFFVELEFWRTTPSSR